MSEIKVNSIKGVGASVAALSINNTDGTCTANITSNGGGQLSNRNVIINGAMQVNQRGNLTGQTSSVYSLDRFRLAMGSAGTWSLSQSTDTPDGFGNSMKLDCTTANGSLSAGSYMILQQKIEGQNVQGFAKGTSVAKQFAVSFYIKSNVSGTYTAEVQDNDNNRIASKTFTVSDGNWNRYSLIFPADTTGAFDNDNAQSLSLNIWLVGGSDYTSGTLNTSSWATKTNANRVSSSNVNLASSTSNELYITGVQLEVGSVATDFEHRSIAQELALCQRYYFKYLEGNNREIGAAWYYTNTHASFFFEFPTTMRVAPTGSATSGTDYYHIYRNGGADGLNSVAFETASTEQTSAFNSTQASGTAGQCGLIRSTNASAMVEFTAEL